MPAQWSIKNQTEWETQYKTKHGPEEYARRLAIANQKADGLTDWQERMFLRPQFHSVAMQLSSEVLAKAETKSSRAWALVVYKLAGV